MIAHDCFPFDIFDQGIKLWVKRADRRGLDYTGVTLAVPADGDDLKRAALSSLLPGAKAALDVVILHRVVSDSTVPTPDEERTALISPRFRPEQSIDSLGDSHFLVGGLGGKCTGAYFWCTSRQSHLDTWHLCRWSACRDSRSRYPHQKSAYHILSTP